MKKLFFLLIVSCIITIFPKDEVDIDEHLGSKLPLNVTFTDETGKEVKLYELFDKPVVLAFVYYKCPGICSPLMTEMANTLSRTELKPGTEFRVITVSMDETENYKDAAEKKNTILSLTEKEVPHDAWSFMTGSKDNIKKLADAAGYYFKRNGKDFLHTGVFIFASKDGKICRYLYPDYSRKGGFSILPFDFKMAVIEANEGRPIKTMAKLVQYCFSYDPAGRTYVLNITRIFGAGILLFMAVFVAFIIKKPGKKNIKQENNQGDK